MLKGHRTNEKISEFFARAQIIADTMEVVLLIQICSKDSRQLIYHRIYQVIELARHHLLLITRKSSLEFIVNVVKKGKVHCCSAELTLIAIVVTKYILSILKHLTLFLQKTNCIMVVA
jgi:hypothetical protein